MIRVAVMSVVVAVAPVPFYIMESLVTLADGTTKPFAPGHYGVGANNLDVFPQVPLRKFCIATPGKA